MSAVPASSSRARSSGEAAAHVEGASQVRWHDPKRYAWLLGLIVPTLPFLA